MPYAIATSKSSSQVDLVPRQNTRTSHVDKSTPNVHHDIRGSASQPVPLSNSQGTSCSSNIPADSGVERSHVLPPPEDAEDPLPDDSPMTYIGKPPDSKS